MSNVTLIYPPEKVDQRQDGFAVTRVREGDGGEFVTFIPNGSVHKTYMLKGQRVIVVTARVARRFALGASR